MKIRPLLISPRQKEDIGRVITFAERNPITLEEMQKAGDPEGRIRQGDRVNFNRGDGDLPSVGDDPMRWCVVPVGYRCAFSFDEQPPPLGWCRHLSVSVIPTEKGAYPSIPAVRMLASEFGFRGMVGAESTILVYNEVEFQAINIVQPILPEERERMDL
jgi:hypothetical protein